MGAVSPDELAGIAMTPVWEKLTPVREFTDSMRRFVLEELSPTARFDAAGMTLALKLCCEFRNEIWPHRVPTTWELVLADRAGHLYKAMAELERAYRRGE